MLTEEQTNPRDLMARAQAGDPDAFGEIYARYHDEVFRCARARLPHLAEDIAQDVFVLALKNLHRWHDQGIAPGAWLRTIAVNRCASLARSSYATKTVLTDITFDQPDPADGPDKQALDRLVSKKVAEALKALPDEQRRAITLYYLHGLSTAETARAMDRGALARQATSSMLHRARRTLAKSLAAVADVN